MTSEDGRLPAPGPTENPAMISIVTVVEVSARGIEAAAEGEDAKRADRVATISVQMEVRRSNAAKFQRGVMRAAGHNARASVINSPTCAS